MHSGTIEHFNLRRLFYIMKLQQMDGNKGFMYNSPELLVSKLMKQVILNLTTRQTNDSELDVTYRTQE